MGSPRLSSPDSALPREPATSARRSASALNESDVTAHVVRALVLYALAEFQAGHAKTLRVSAEGTSFSVSDDGRGHAIDRTVAGSPYLAFIYTHLDYPEFARDGGPVQLQGIGMSLLNTLCSELSVAVRKKTGTLHSSYRSGCLHEELRAEPANEATGNTVSGTVNARFQGTATDVDGMEHWLVDVLAANPALDLYFNGKKLHARAARAG